MRAGDKIIHLEFKEPTKGKKNHYFGSISAVYDKFNSKEIGCGISLLRKFKVESNKPYVNEICIIRKDNINRKKGNRTVPIHTTK